MEIPEPMTPRRRLDLIFTGQEADRTPALGGWIACPDHIASLAGVSLESYWENPMVVSIRAYETLEADGLIDCYVPPRREDFRCVDASSYVHARTAMTLGEALDYIDRMPGPEEVERRFDMESAYEEFSRGLKAGQDRCSGMVWMPAQWSAGARATWYGTFGYELFFEIVGAYSDRARKLMEVGGAEGRCRSLLIARAVREGLYPQAVLLGEDICTQRGPMVSPRFLERYWAPQVRYGLAPLVDCGCRPVWHCDGDVRPLLDMLLDCGVQGLQGFQPECGMTLDLAASLKTREGKPLLIFGPLAVTTQLPVLTPSGIRAQVREAIETCRGRAHLILFSANTINPDVPLDNIRAMYDAALR